jgi:hypothetical protein
VHPVALAFETTVSRPCAIAASNSAFLPGGMRMSAIFENHGGLDSGVVVLSF